MEEKISKILDLMLAGIEKAGSLAANELPGLLEDYMSYYFIQAIPLTAIAWTLISVVSAIIIFFICKTVVEDENKKERPCSDITGVYLFLLIPLFVFIPASLCVLEGTKEIISIKVAPKAYLIEKLRR